MDFKDFLYVVAISIFTYMVIMAITQLPDMTFEVLTWILSITIIFLCIMGFISKHTNEKFAKV